MATGYGLLAWSADGSTRTVLSSEPYADGVWVEGDQVLFSSGERLRSMPRTGGAATVVLDGGHHNDPSTPADGGDMVLWPHVLDATAFYWITTGHPYTEDTHIWRMLRKDGTLEGFASLPIFVDGIAATDDGVLAVGPSTLPGEASHGAYVARWGGQGARQLPADVQHPVSGMVSVESTGFVWTTSTGNRDARPETYEVWMSPADGSAARPISAQLPPAFLATTSVADDRGGRFVGGVEAFDGYWRGSLFHISGDGAATRLACDPASHLGRGTAFLATLAPDGVYWVVMNDDPSWELVRTPRP